MPPVGAGQQAQRAQPQLQRFFLPSLPPLPTPLTTDVRIFQPQGRSCAPWRGGPPRPPMVRPAELRGRRGGRGHQAGTRPRSLIQPLPFLMRNGCALRSAHQGFVQRWAGPRCWGAGPHAGRGRADGWRCSTTTLSAGAKSPPATGPRSAPAPPRAATHPPVSPSPVRPSPARVPPAMVAREPSVGFRPVCCASGLLLGYINLR